MIQKIKNNKWIIVIILLAALLRLYGISRGDPLNDETLMAFRAIGMIDFDEAAYQTTPFEWFDPLVKFSPTVPDEYRIGTGIPWWAHLSWHDHPALVFAVQHTFMSIFGDVVWAFRLPSAIWGVLSVYLIYLIGQRLYDKRAGLFAALIYAVTVNGVYISRTGMQESYVIFFILSVLYLFLLALEKDKFFIFAGVTLGLGLLAKYTVFFVTAPMIGAYILVFRRDVLRSKKLWLGIAVFVVVISPSIIYNIELYRAVGHFDFQLSYIFKQNHPAWQVEPGKDIGSLRDRMRELIPRLIATNSWVFLGLFAISIFSFLVSILRNGLTTIKKHSLLMFSFVSVIVLLLVIGPSYRFLTMLAPFMALAVGVLAENLVSRRMRCLMLFGVAVLFFEIFYSWNNQIAYYPVGSQPWLSSKVRYENYNWGYNELTKYFEKEFVGKMPALTFDLRYQFLNQLRDDALADGLRAGYESYPALVVYFGNFDKAGKLWSLDRLHIYHAWPVISLQDHDEYIRINGPDYFSRSGFQDLYYVIPVNSVADARFSVLVAGLAPVEIKNPRGDTAFMVYKRK